MRSCSILAICIVMLACGCRQQNSTGFQPGDVCQAEIVYAPDGPWTAGTKVSIGMLVRLQRAGGASNYLSDTAVVPEQATMMATITFFDVRRILGEPLEVPFVRDC
jgi:hypothetical protein